jgi:hypothetical protein
VIIACVSQNFLLNRGGFKNNQYFTLEGLGGVRPVSSGREGGSNSLSNLLFFTNAPLSGLFNKNVDLELLKDFATKSRHMSSKKSTININFSHYESLLSLVFRISNFTGVSVGLTSSASSKGINFLIRSLLFFLSVTTFLMLSLYVLTLFFYKLDVVIPESLNLNLVNITFILFSFTNFNLLSSKDFVDFLSLVTKANYNNLNESHSSLSIQQKYFLKHESTYFSDKKCSET